MEAKSCILLLSTRPSLGPSSLIVLHIRVVLGERDNGVRPELPHNGKTQLH